uniref:Ion transport 2 domain protein n=1 Tax=Cyanothece sp. (strain PCC 7425 / ATCC 29141) TaxID=395961 RepID=B8HU35_CYAP4
MVQSVENSPTPKGLRQRVAFYLEDTQTPLAIAIDLLITALVLISLAIFVVDTYPLPSPIRVSLKTINDSILVIFAIEYGLRLWAAENRLRYCLSLYSVIDLLTILPFFVGAVNISFIRIFRWFRILRLLRFFKGRSFFGLINTTDGIIFVRIVFTLIAIVFVYSGLIYQAEHDVNPQNFRTFLDAFYFAVVTMTTVGFGDVTPTSDLGRLLTVMMIFTGIALIPWQVGDLIRQLVKTNRSEVKSLCPTCRLAQHDQDAQFCKVCGTKLKTLSMLEQ